MSNFDIVERVAKLEERTDLGFKFVNETLKDLKDNHLHTLQTDVDDLKLKVNTIAVKISVAVAIITVVIDIVFRVFFK